MMDENMDGVDKVAKVYRNPKYSFVDKERSMQRYTL